MEEHVVYGQPLPPKKPPSKEVLQKHLDSVRERIAQIELLLQTDAHRPEQSQELKSERQIHSGTKADLERMLNPPAADAELARAHAESLRQQAEQMRLDNLPEPPDVLEERKRNAALRREELLNAEEKESTSVLLNQIDRWEREGQYGQAKLLRVQLARLRLDLEERYPA
jgi:hypothetical protein